MEVGEIRKWVKEQRDIRHSARIKERKEDMRFFKDEYDIPLIKDKKYQVRTGFVANMVNGVTQQLVSNTPRVFTKEKSKGKKEASERIASVSNRELRKLAHYPDNPIEQTFKNNLFGDAWIYVPHMPEIAKAKYDWRESNPDLIPVFFRLYDPMVVFAEPTEEINGIPKRVGVCYEILAREVNALYPNWSDKNYKDNEKVIFTLYFEKDFSYAEADEKPLFKNMKGNLLNGDGRRGNPYGFVPFAHSYSGWGISTESMEPDLLAYSRIRMLREKLVNKSTMDSDFKRNIHETAWKHRVVTLPQGTEYNPDKAFENYSSDPEAISVVEIPSQGEFKVEETRVFDAAVFAYWDRKGAELLSDYPLAMQGATVGGSGRHQDIARESGLEFYDCCIQNTGHLWATALDMAFRICEKLDILPNGLKEGDSQSYTDLTVDLVKQSPQELSRRSAEGDQKFLQGIISLKDNLIEYQGKTLEEAEMVEARKIADEVKRNHPFFREMIAKMVAEEHGLGEEFAQYMQSMMGQGANPTVERGKEGGEPALSNIKTPLGGEMAGMGRHESRLSPRTR